MSDPTQSRFGDPASSAPAVLEALQEIYLATTVKRRQTFMTERSLHILNDNDPLRAEWEMIERSDVRNIFLGYLKSAEAIQYWTTAAGEVAGFIAAKKCTRQDEKDYEPAKAYEIGEEEGTVTAEDISHSEVSKERFRLLQLYARNQEFNHNDSEYEKRIKRKYYKDLVWWEIDILGVLRGHQRMGIGKVLVHAIKDQAPEEQKPIYVCSELTAVGFYEKQGFKRLYSPREKNEEELYGVYMMWRPDGSSPISARQKGEEIEASGYLLPFREG
ncbi:hypothetical protein GGR57DRAFT_506185 [Xylariaceae sp. FL1272]|nr:hypothetical protein GGR57DRAFT_506185 [Xylariaceae sp. FL1272]